MSWEESKHPRDGAGRFGSGNALTRPAGGSKTAPANALKSRMIPDSEVKDSAFREAVQHELDNVLYEAGADNIDQLRMLATEGRDDAAEWKKASRRCDKLETEAIDKAYGKEHHGPMSHKDYDHLLSPEFHALQARIGAIAEKYGVEDAGDLASFAKHAPAALAKADRLLARLQRK